MGRTTLKTPEMINGILDLIIAGYNLSSICSKKGMPARWTVHRWLLEDREFYKAYNKAVSLRAHETFLDVFEIADRPKATHKDVAADRLRCSVRLRAAAIANPSLKRARRRTRKNKIDFQLPDELELNIVRGEEEHESAEGN